MIAMLLELFMAYYLVILSKKKQKNNHWFIEIPFSKMSSFLLGFNKGMGNLLYCCNKNNYDLYPNSFEKMLSFAIQVWF